MSAEPKVDQRRPTRLMPAKTAQALLAAQPKAECGEAERLALFACALGRDTALDILDGLAEPRRRRAREYARAVVSWDSPTRQAKVALEFGAHPEAAKRLRSIMAEAAPALRRAMFRLLPPYHRTLFPELADSQANRAEPVAPALAALAHRLVREATR